MNKANLHIVDAVAHLKIYISIDIIMLAAALTQSYIITNLNRHSCPVLVIATGVGYNGITINLSCVTINISHA